MKTLNMLFLLLLFFTFPSSLSADTYDDFSYTITSSADITNNGNVKKNNHDRYTIKIDENGTFAATLSGDSDVKLAYSTSSMPDTKSTNATLSSTGSIAVLKDDIVYISVHAPDENSDQSYTITLSLVATVSGDEPTSTIIENADDICYESAESSGLMCIDLGICSGGIGCKNSYPIKNIGDAPLSDVVIDYDETGLGGTFGTSSSGVTSGVLGGLLTDNCGVEPEGSCESKSNIDLGPIGLLGQATEFRLSNSIAVGDNSNSIWGKSFLEGSCFSGESLYATYTKNGVSYRGKVSACDEQPALPADETLPTDDAESIGAACDTFADMFQTHGTCSGTSGGSIKFTNAGQLLDGSKNIILNTQDDSLNTCDITTKTDVGNQYETCGTAGDCTASGTAAESFNITYANAPATAIVSDTPTSSTTNVTLDGTSSLSDFEYDTVSNSWNVNTTTFGITNQLKINTLTLTQGNSITFNSNDAYSLDIGKVNGNSGNTIATDSSAKNIKINTFLLPSGTTLTLEAAQTIKMEDFTVGRGSTVSLKAPYVNINNFTSSNSGNGDSTIKIYADYIDIGDLTLNQTVSLKIYPYTAGKRVLFRTNTLNESSSSSIQMSSGNYYVNTSLTIPGTSDISALRAIDAAQMINLYVNSDLSLGNNPGINATGNNGNYATDYPAANFMMFIKGDLTTSGGGTTINATIYVEEDVTLGNPTYIKGAISAANITVGQGQFQYDQSLESGGFGECSDSDIPIFQNEYSCGIFDNVLTTYDSITSVGGHDEAFYTDSIAYPEGGITGDLTCTNDGVTADCLRDDPPANKLEYTVYVSSKLGTSESAPSGELTELEYGDFNGNFDLTLNPSQTYQDNTTKVMLLGDITLTGANTLSLAPGDYYINSLTFTKNNPYIILSGSGPVRIFIKNDFIVTKNGLNVNADGTTSDLFVYVAGDMDFQTNGNVETLNGFFYVEGSAKFDANSQNFNVHGAITAEGPINISGQNGDFYQDSDASDLGYGECNGALTVGFEEAAYYVDENISLPDNDLEAFPIKIVLSHAADFNISVDYTTRNDSAIADTDYLSSTGTVSFTAGETESIIKIFIRHDVDVELQENFFIDLSNLTPADGTVEYDINPTEVFINAQETVQNCFTDDFDTDLLSDDWRTLYNSGDFTPKIKDGRLRMTPAVNHISTSVTKDYSFAAANNLMIIEFDSYSYSGTGADGMTIVLYDNQYTSPYPGGYGGSLGYSKRGGINGFEGGWLGLGIDEFGNYSNPTEGRDGGTSFTKNAVAIRGKSPDNTYLEGTGSLSPVLWKSEDNYTNGHYKMTVDSRDPSHLYISLTRTVDGTESTIISQFDAISEQGTPPEYVRLAITASTGASNAVHEIDNLVVDGVCREYMGTVAQLNFLDAWETDRGISDRNITTKIVNKPFNLTIANLNDEGNSVTAVEDITIQYQLYDYATAVAVTTYEDFNLSNGSIGRTFSIDAGAYQDVRVRFKFCEEVDLESDTHTVVDKNFCENNANGYIYNTDYASSDNFAIRPDKFSLSEPSGVTITKLKAGKEYAFPLIATQYGNSLSSYLYTIPSADTNLSLEKIMYLPDNTVATLDGTLAFGSTTFDIVNGEAVGGANLMFSDVGKVNISLQDRLWAAVDSDDTGADCSTDGLYICGEINATFIPDHFTLTDVKLHNSDNSTFTYFSNDLNQSAKISLTITAENSADGTTSNFSSGKWENPVDVTFTVNPVSSANKEEINGGSNLGFGTGTITLAWDETNSSKLLKFNYPRTINSAKNPTKVLGTDASVTASSNYNGTSITGSALASDSATFIYGRTNAPRQKFSDGATPAEHDALIYYEAYCYGTGCNITLLPGTPIHNDDPRWWINTAHAATSGRVTTPINEKSNSGTMAIDSSSLSGANPDTVKVEYNSNNGYPYVTTMENNASSWLIYNKYNAAADSNEFTLEFYRDGGDYVGSGVSTKNININRSTNTDSNVNENKSWW